MVNDYDELIQKRKSVTKRAIAQNRDRFQHSSHSNSIWKKITAYGLTTYQNPNSVVGHHIIGGQCAMHSTWIPMWKWLRSAITEHASPKVNRGNLDKQNKIYFIENSKRCFQQHESSIRINYENNKFERNAPGVSAFLPPAHIYSIFIILCFTINKWW